MNNAVSSLIILLLSSFISFLCKLHGRVTSSKMSEVEANNLSLVNAVSQEPSECCHSDEEEEKARIFGPIPSLSRTSSLVDESLRSNIDIDDIDTSDDEDMALHRIAMDAIADEELKIHLSKDDSSSEPSVNTSSSNVSTSTPSSSTTSGAATARPHPSAIPTATAAGSATARRPPRLPSATHRRSSSSSPAPTPPVKPTKSVSRSKSRERFTPNASGQSATPSSTPSSPSPIQSSTPSPSSNSPSLTLSSSTPTNSNIASSSSSSNNSGSEKKKYIYNQPKSRPPPSWEGAKLKSKTILEANKFLSMKDVRNRWEETYSKMNAGTIKEEEKESSIEENKKWYTILKSMSAVCAIRLPNGRCGTGFLFGDGYMMTNAHIIETIDDARVAKVQFFYTSDAAISSTASSFPVPFPPSSVSIALNPKELFISSPKVLFTLPDNDHLDYTIIKLKLDDPVNVEEEENIRMVKNIVPLELCTGHIPAYKELAYVIQHPLGKSMVVHEDEITKIGKQYIRYKVDTSYGSSGSPVMNERGVIALHHKSVSETRELAGENQGIIISTIVDDINTKSCGIMVLWSWNQTCLANCKIFSIALFFIGRCALVVDILIFVLFFCVNG